MPGLLSPPTAGVIDRLAAVTEDAGGGVPGLLAVLAKVADPRHRRGVRHRLAVILNLAVCAVLTGARSFTAIAEWAADADEETLARLGVTGAVPSESTFRRTLQRLDAGVFDDLAGHWAAHRTTPGPGRRRVIAVDGGISLFASVIIITLLWSRLVVHKPGAAVMVPTLWIVLGPLGQSVTAAGNLGTQAARVLPEPYAAGAAVFALLYGVPTWGFAMMWLALAAAITVRTARRGLPFALTWWSFTFPVGTCVTGTIALAARSHAEALRAASVIFYALLLAAWLVVTGRLFKPMTAAARSD